MNVAIYRFLGIAAVISSLSGCTTAGALHDYLSEVFPSGSAIKITDTCGGTLGLSAAVAVIEVSLPGGAPPLNEESLATETGRWTRQESLQEFIEQHAEPAGIGVTVGDGKDCLLDLRDDAEALLFEPSPGFYYRSNNQMVVIMLPDSEPGRGVVFAQGR
ncbi:MAG: hypothetical protein JNK19_08865 [Tabrizicola sp.]|nr:hypothetical protein [Tabrizicola sp.]